MIQDEEDTSFVKEEDRELFFQEWEGITLLSEMIFTNVSKLLDFINVNDRKIIEERFSDLKELAE